MAEPLGASRWTALGLSGLGLAVSVYLTVEHYTAPGTLACPAGTTINCERVTTSEQSTFIGVPVALLGALFFAAMVAICLPFAWRLASPLLHRARLALAGLGVIFVLWLIYAELFIIDAICLWCTVVHVIAVALFGVIVATSDLASPPPAPPPSRPRAGRSRSR